MNLFKSKSVCLSLIALCMMPCSLSAQSVGGAVFEFISSDPPGTGFNDQTPTSSLDPSIVGDNPGDTLGELRENVLVAAGNRWSKFLLSDVPIEVDVDFQDFGGSSGGSITLAAAGAASRVQNFANAPLQGVLYPIALANSLAGVDLSGGVDISVSANSNDELSDSLAGAFTWYYGLDNNAPFGTIDFLNVISHELGHGLGFSSGVNTATGAFFGGSPDAFSMHIFDTNFGLTWPEMTAAQRVISATSDPSLTWSGPNVTGVVNGVQTFVNAGTNRSASTNNNTFPAAAATFGATIPTSGFSGSVVLVDDGVGVENGNGVGSTADLAEDVVNGGALSGNIALIARGIVNFDEKVRRAQDAGAVAAIIYNNTATGLISITASGTVVEPTIPILFVSQATGGELRNLLNTGLSVTLFPSSVLTDASEVEPTEITRLRLFAPSTLQPGSSVSHWTTASSPNLLMEPSINGDIVSDLDLSVLLMKDIGWRTRNISIPHLTYELWLEDQGLTGLSETEPDENHDQDSLSNLEEYYFGTDPTVNSAHPLLITRNALMHTRSRLANDLIVNYERGFTLTDFNPFSVSETTTDVDSGIEEAAIGINTDADEEFFRLSIQRLDDK